MCVRVCVFESAPMLETSNLCSFSAFEQVVCIKTFVLKMERLNPVALHELLVQYIVQFYHHTLAEYTNHLNRT